MKEAKLGRVIRMEIIDAVTPDPEEVFGLIVRTEAHRKVVWTAGRVLREAALWGRVEELDYEGRKIVLNRITGFLGDLAARGVLHRRGEPQSIGYGDEAGFDYVAGPAIRY